MLGEVKQQIISTPHSLRLLKEWHLTTTCHEGGAVNQKEFHQKRFACLVSPNTKICLPSNSY